MKYENICTKKFFCNKNSYVLSYNTNDIKSSQIELFQPCHIFKILPISGVLKMKIYLNLLQQQQKNWNLISSFLVTSAAAISWCCKKTQQIRCRKRGKDSYLKSESKIFSVHFLNNILLFHSNRKSK